MAKIAKIEVTDSNPLTSLKGFFKSLLETGELKGLMVPQHLPMKNVVMPTLVTDPEKLEGADPLAPVFPLNAAKLVGRLTRKPLHGSVAAVLRPCEIRAFIELVKLKQGSMEEVVLVGVDCPGAYSNVNYPRFAGENRDDATLKFLGSALDGGSTAFEDFDISTACMACEHPVPRNADLSIGLFGVDVNKELIITANTDKGEDILDKVGLSAAEEPGAREGAIAALVEKRTAYRDRMFEETSEATSDIEKLNNYLASCVNCYNCRVACPVCYCRECVFLTDAFDHEPVQYLSWAKGKGMLKMPTDTVFFHLTRLVHMSTACVGCGQCSNACPNNVPVVELFKTLASYTQKAFAYEAGRSPEEEPPLSVFHEAEFPEVTGGKH